jgi:iron(III) transport system ATP-binding protein
MPVLELKDIRQSYGERTVLNGLSLQLAEGEIACLLGASGCGKTTALRCIAGFEPVADGEIILNGNVVSHRGLMVAPELRRIGMVFQDYALFPHLTVERNVAFGLHREPEAGRAARVAELLDIVGLDTMAKRYPHELSGGQQQRVALARALAPRPALMLLDEPFSSLDVDMREHLSVEVRRILKQQNTSAVLVTHDQNEAFNIADQVGIIANGRIEQWDTPYKLYHEPANRFVADFIGQGTFLTGAVVDSHRVKVEIGILEADVPLQCPQGAQVDVLLRPDDILHDDASPLQAKVLYKSFRGAEFLYTLELPGGGKVMSLVPSHHNHAIGEKIGIRLEIDHLVVFAREA